MNIRCTSCNKAADFRNTRGSRIKDLRCKCGGIFEKVSAHSVEGRHPLWPDSDKENYQGRNGTIDYHYVYKNSKGQMFYRDRFGSGLRGAGVYPNYDNPYIPVNINPTI